MNLTPVVARATTCARAKRDVSQYVRPFVPRDHVWREPWRRARLRGRWLSARNSTHRRRYPAVAGQTPPGAVAFHHAAARTGHGEDPVGHLPGRERTGRH